MYPGNSLTPIILQTLQKANSGHQKKPQLKSDSGAKQIFSSLNFALV